MRFFVSPTDSPHPKTKNIRPISLGLAAVLTVMVVAQLFTFEDFSAVIASFRLLGGERLSLLYASSIVTLEVLALPFLLSLRLSSAMRIMSMVAGWLTATAWLKLSLWALFVTGQEVNSGVLGATVPLLVGGWTVCFAFALTILVAWSSWGMWPFTHKK